MSIKAINAETGISIHTPAKGVTLVLLCIPDRIAISIHTPAKGVTGARLPRVPQHRDFNPHPRVGGDSA